MRRQRGMTLIELLVALALTSVVLLALNGVFVNATSHYQEWADRIHSASIPSALAADLQADSHRYAVCSGFQQQLSTLDFCSMGARVVRYRVTGAAPYMITREKPVGGTATFLARGQSASRPYFWADCFSTGNVASGHVHVYNLRVGDGEGGNDPNNFMVYYATAEVGSCS
jgi:prepilin-type N-terminal cleavage/methylation domain-containing protein